MLLSACKGALGILLSILTIAILIRGYTKVVEELIKIFKFLIESLNKLIKKLKASANR